MQVATLVGNYFVWHYSRAYRELIHIERNIIWFLFHFFSLPELTRTFLSPWKRLGENYGSIFDTEEFFAALITNVLMRIVGIVMRAIIIVAGIAVLSITLLGAAVMLLLRTLLPLVIVFAFITGIVLTILP